MFDGKQGKQREGILATIPWLRLVWLGFAPFCPDHQQIHNYFLYVHRNVFVLSTERSRNTYSNIYVQTNVGV